jgi:hypothetical protein
MHSTKEAIDTQRAGKTDVNYGLQLRCGFAKLT